MRDYYMKDYFRDLQESKDEIYFTRLDDRYYMPEIDYGKTFPEFRLAISYGPNLTIDMNKDSDLTLYDEDGSFIDFVKCKPFFAPPRQDGGFVYGLHTVIVDPNSNKVWMADEWVTSYAAKEPHYGLFATGDRLLARISDKKYSQLCQGTVCLFNSESRFVRPGGDISDSHSSKYKICCSVNPDNSKRVKIRPIKKSTFTDRLWFRGIDLFSFMNHMSLSNEN